MADQESKPHVAIIPSPGMGHLIPLVELAKRLVGSHNVTVTFVVPTDGSPSKAQLSLLNSLPQSIDHVFVSPVSLDDLTGEDVKIETLITLTIARSIPQIRHALNALTARGVNLAAVVVDLFGTDVFDVAFEVGVAPYIFFPSTATVLSLIFHLPKLDETVSCEYKDLPEVEIPGYIPIPGSELFDPMHDRNNDAYKWVLYNAKRYRLAEGVLVNSFKELEPGVVTWLLKEEEGRPRVYPVGPLANVESNAKFDESNCLTWLDGQPSGSVLYVSFGSGGTLSSAQVNELALGLETSQQRFLWVVRPPNDTISNAGYFNTYARNDALLDFLPDGFLERTRDRGFVVLSWAPQAEVLAHGSIGGFLSHCGWNSTLESVVNGVPLIAWPLYAEQKMNALILENEAKIALRPKILKDENLVKKEEVAKVVKNLFEGEEGKALRNRMKELKETAWRALSQDGDSTKTLSHVVDKWKNNIHASKNLSQ